MPKPSTNVPRDGNGTDNVEKPQVAGNNGLGFDDRPLRNAAKQKGALEIPSSKRREEIAMRLEKEGRGIGPRISNHSESQDIVGNSDRLRIQPGELSKEEASPGARGSPGIAALLPSYSVMDKLAGAPANDHLANVEDGEGTYLNTKEWKYSTFFNRLKQSVGMHWDPVTPWRQRDPTGAIYGGRDRYTVLTVTLNERGMVKDIFVAKSSGLDFLDLEAVHSFERAQPFPNPPPGLIAGDSTVRFNFGFFLELGGSPRIRLFRSGN
jgi:TonB family protein